MANCNSGNNVLDPYQNIIDSINRGVTTLENQASIIQPFIDEFDTLASAITTPTPVSSLNAALNQFTADAICATSTDLQPINDFTEDCLNEALSTVKKYLKDIYSNIEDGVDLIYDLLTLPEGTLFKAFQKVRGLTGDIKDLVTALDNKIQCISLSNNASEYQDQIDDINSRISDVMDDLRLSDDGNFDSEIFLAELDSDLKNNVQSYETKAQNLKTEIENNISSTVDLGGTIVPRKYI